MHITDDILREVQRATNKFPTWPTDPHHALNVVGEEYGELTKEVVQLTYEPHKSSLESVRTEAIQLAAMALRFAMSLDVYRYTPCHQHSQQPSTPLLPREYTSEGSRYVGMTLAQLDEQIKQEQADG